MKPAVTLFFPIFYSRKQGNEPLTTKIMNCPKTPKIYKCVKKNQC